MNGRLIQRLRRLAVWLQEWRAWRDRARLPLEGEFQAFGRSGRWRIRPGERWPVMASRVLIRLEAAIPLEWAGCPVAVRLRPGGEGLLMANGHPVGGLDPFHTEWILVSRARGGERMTLEVEVEPYGPSGQRIREPRWEQAELVVPEPAVRALEADLRAALEAAAALARHGREDVAEALAEAIEDTLRSLPLPRSPTAAYLARLAQDPEMADRFEQLWEGWSFHVAPLPLPEDLRAAIPAARAAFQERLEALRREFPPEGALHLCGHAHLDLAWLWPLEETRRKARRTFATVLRWMEQDPEFRFGQSMAQIYADLEREDPALFERIRERVAEGRWEVLGGMWVEPDGNLPSGEAWARQLLYGQRYFESRFGRRARVAWLPDTFGFSGNLPQLFLQAGMPYFFTTKLNWNETNPFPYDLYWWEGIDGSRVLAHSFHGPYGFNGRLEAEELLSVWRAYRGKRHHRSSLYTFGHGDGGGGPTEEMLEAYRRYREFPALPRLTMGSIERFFESVDPTDLPVWRGEQYLEFHRGTYTTQARLKTLNRRLEHLLVEAEAACALASILLSRPYPQEALRNLWITLLRNQFHDILPGSSITTVVREAEAELQGALRQAKALREEALTRLSREVNAASGAAGRLVCWNLTLEDRPLRVLAPRPFPGPFRLQAPDGREVPYQELEGGWIAIGDGSLEVPGLGYLALEVHEGAPSRFPTRVHLSERRLANGVLEVEIDTDGTLRSLFDLETGREILADRGNQIWMYGDLPREWEAWDIDPDYIREGRDVRASEPPISIEHGPLRAAMRVIRRLEGGTIEQIYRLWAGSRRLEIETRIAWGRRRTMVRALFPVAVRHHEAWFETAFGAVARPTHRNTSWEAARFEVPGHRWADLSEAGYGVSLLNDGRYGYSVLGNVLGLTLLRAPVHPDPWADEGAHRFTYALYPHPGDWRAGTVSEAHDLNAPMPVIWVEGAEGRWPAAQRLIGLEVQGGGALRLAALKQAEDERGWILRVYEAHGGRGRARWREGPFRTGEPVSLLEEPMGAGGREEFFFTPYQVLSWRFR